MEKQAITEDMRKALRADFPEEAYSKHPTKTFLTTLKAMYVTERLNDVFGIGRWDLRHSVVERTDDYVLISGYFESLDYDVTVPIQYGGHKTSGTNTEIADGYKSAVTDCISKVASMLEVGIDMFKGKIQPREQTQKADNKKWLNEKNGSVKTKDWKNIEVKVSDGTITNIKQIESVYKFRKEVREKLEQLIK